MSPKRKRERRRAIAANRAQDKISQAGLGIPKRKVVPVNPLPGISRPATVTPSNVRDVPSLPRRVPASFSSKALAVPVSRLSTVKPVRVPSKLGTPSKPVRASVSKARPVVSPLKPATLSAVTSPSVQPSKPASTPSRTPLPTCKSRPASSSSKGGGSRSFIPWCR